MPNDYLEDPHPTHLRPWTYTRKAILHLSGCLVFLGCPLLGLLMLANSLLSR